MIALAMNGLLAVLLVAALAFGVRLDRKLKGVRDGQLAFTKAVADLNEATSRAQAGLADLRAATDEATDNLGGRIARAREAADRLDKLLARAESLPVQTAAAPQGPEGGLAALLASVAEAAETISPAPMARRERAPLPERAPRPMRARPVVDDDLFEDAGGR
jgi:hypothetical protein